MLEFTIKGQTGDLYSYAITRKDGTVVRAAIDEFRAPQREVFVHTSVPNADVSLVTIKASGRIGVAGDCVMTTIR